MVGSYRWANLSSWRHGRLRHDTSFPPPRDTSKFENNRLFYSVLRIRSSYFRAQVLVFYDVIKRFDQIASPDDIRTGRVSWEINAKQFQLGTRVWTTLTNSHFSNLLASREARIEKKLLDFAQTNTDLASNQTGNLTKTCCRITIYCLTSFFKIITAYEKALPDERTKHNAFS